MEINKERFILIVACVVWVLIIGVGLGFLLKYENAAGPATPPPSVWPADSRIRHDTGRATLVMIAHPHCPCSRASIGELDRLMAQVQGRVTAYVLLVKPAGSPEGWERADLWQNAASIPGVNVLVDDGGDEARRFHAMTSGQTVLYDADGRLLFSGGITASRGHSGDNAGRSAVVSLLNTGEVEAAVTPTYGCPLFGAQSECRGALNNGNDH